MAGRAVEDIVHELSRDSLSVGMDTPLLAGVA